MGYEISFFCPMSIKSFYLIDMHSKNRMYLFQMNTNNNKKKIYNDFYTNFLYILRTYLC